MSGTVRQGSRSSTSSAFSGTKPKQVQFSLPCSQGSRSSTSSAFSGTKPKVVKLSLLCRKVVFLSLLVLICLGSSPFFAQAATLFLSPSSGSYKVGQTFTVVVYVNSSDQAVNAASFQINFPANILKVVSLSKTGSIISQWMPKEPGFSNIQGTVHGEGIVLNPGFQGANGKLLSVVFKASSIGKANLSLGQTSVLANDGQGTQILSSVQGANFNVIPLITKPVAPESETPLPFAAAPAAPEIISSTHPDPNQWYISTKAQFSWKLPKGITADRVLINRDPHSRPTVIYSPAISSKEALNLDEGKWYFHVQLKNKYGWGDITHFQVQVDTTAPQPFSLKIDNGGDSTNPRPLLRFHTEDALSGIDHYEIAVGNILNKKVSPSEVKEGYYVLPVCSPGSYSVIVRAVDKAGNYSLAVGDVEVSPIEAPVITKYPKRIYPGDPLIIKGTSSRKGDITLFVQNERKEVITARTSVENGQWRAVLGKTLSRGIYLVWAKTIDQRGAESIPSRKYRVVVTPSAFIRIGGILIDYLSVMNSLLAIVIFMVLVWLYGRKRVRILKRQIRKETTEAEEALYKAFRSLEKETSKEIAKLDGKEGLSSREKRISRDLKKALNNSEKIVAKEIRDIEKRINS